LESLGIESPLAGESRARADRAAGPCGSHDPVGDRGL